MRRPEKVPTGWKRLGLQVTQVVIIIWIASNLKHIFPAFGSYVLFQILIAVSILGIISRRLGDPSAMAEIFTNSAVLIAEAPTAVSVEIALTPPEAQLPRSHQAETRTAVQRKRLLKLTACSTY